MAFPGFHLLNSQPVKRKLFELLPGPILLTKYFLAPAPDLRLEASDRSLAGDTMADPLWSPQFLILAVVQTNIFQLGIDRALKC